MSMNIQIGAPNSNPVIEEKVVGFEYSKKQDNEKYYHWRFQQHLLTAKNHKAGKQNKRKQPFFGGQASPNISII